GTNAIKARKPATARSNPSAPPASDNSMLSVSNWRDNCQELAPNAVRSATSRSLPELRTSSRFTIFAQAISSTSPTAPERTSRMLRNFATDGSSIGSTSTPKNLCESGYLMVSCSFSLFNSSRACERDARLQPRNPDRKSTRLNSSHLGISYAVFCLKKKHLSSTDSHNTTTQSRIPTRRSSDLKEPAGCSVTSRRMDPPSAPRARQRTCANPDT